MGRRWLLAGVVWLVLAALTTAVGIGAVNSLRSGLFGATDTPLSEAQVASQLASASPSASPSFEPSPEPSPEPSFEASPEPSSVESRALPTSGGTVTAACTGGLVTLLSWMPRSGFEADHVVRGPAGTASIRFKARSGGHSGGRDIRAQITCVDGTPTLMLLRDD